MDAKICNQFTAPRIKIQIKIENLKIVPTYCKKIVNIEYTIKNCRL